MFTKLVSAIVGVCAMASINLAFAEKLFEEIEVVAKAPPSIDDVERVNLEEFSGFARALTREEFSETVSTVSDVLSDTNGVQIRQVGGYGGFSAISMRGTTGKQVNVYLDGMLLNSAQSGSAELNLVPTSILQRIEVYPDFTPVKLTGSNLGGAINLISLDLFTPMRELNVAMGSNGVKQLGLLLVDELFGWNVMLGADLQEANNDYDIPNDNGTIYNADDDYIEPQNNAGFEQDSVLFKAGRSWDRGGKLEFLVNWNNADKQVPAIDNNNENDVVLETENLRGHVKLNEEYGTVRASHRLYLSEIEYLYDDRQGNVGIANEYAKSIEETRGLANIFSYDWLNSQTIFNIEYQKNSIVQKNLLTGNIGLDNNRESVFLGLQNDAYFLGDTVLISAIVRYQDLNDQVGVDESEIQGVSKDEYGDVSDSIWNGSLGINYAFSEQWKLKANYANQSRVPTLQERFGLQGLLIGNPELTTEKSENMDIGLVWSHSNIDLRALAYTKEITDGIVFSFDEQGVGKAENVSLSEVSGVELDLSWRLLSWVEAYVGATRLDSENLEGSKAELGKKLPGIYHETYDVAFDFNWNRFLFKVSYQFENDLYYNAVNNVWPGEKETVDLMARYGEQEWFVQFNVENVFDEQFQDYNRFWGPGRSFYLSASLTF